MPKKIPVIIDVDTGIDDGVAIAIALFCNRLNVKLITTGAGNSELKDVTTNTLNLLQFLGKGDIPVAEGEEKPLVRDRLALDVHGGKTGLGDYNFPPLTLKPIKEEATCAIYRILTESKEKTDIITIGPLTNIATLFLKHPDCVNKIEKIIFVGGLLDNDRKEPYAGFNVASDPEAVEIVFNSGVPITLCASDMGHIAYLNWKEVVRTKHMNRTGEMFEHIFRSYKDRHVQNGIATHDGAAVACLAYPTMFKYKPAKVFLKYYDSLGTGVVLVDFKAKHQNMQVTTEINVKKFKRLFFKSLRKMP